MGSTSDYPALPGLHQYHTVCGDPQADAFAMFSFQTTVIRIKRNKYQDFSTTCQWIVATKTNEKEELDIFDAVMVGVSHQIHPYVLLESIQGKSCLWSAARGTCIEAGLTSCTCTRQRNNFQNNTSQAAGRWEARRCWYLGLSLQLPHWRG